MYPSLYMFPLVCQAHVTDFHSLNQQKTLNVARLHEEIHSRKQTHLVNNTRGGPPEQRNCRRKQGMAHT